VRSELAAFRSCLSGRDAFLGGAAAHLVYAAVPLSALADYGGSYSLLPADVLAVYAPIMLSGRF
jgi:hypothetical protein